MKYVPQITYIILRIKNLNIQSGRLFSMAKNSWRMSNCRFRRGYRQVHPSIRIAMCTRTLCGFRGRFCQKEWRSERTHLQREGFIWVCRRIFGGERAGWAFTQLYSISSRNFVQFSGIFIIVQNLSTSYFQIGSYCTCQTNRWGFIEISHLTAQDTHLSGAMASVVTAGRWASTIRK